MIQLKRILCPLDLSSESGKALRYATALAHGYGATLCLCHCIEQATSATAAERNRIQQALNQLLEANCGLINPQKLRCEILILTGQPAHALAQAQAHAVRTARPAKGQVNGRGMVSPGGLLLGLCGIIALRIRLPLPVCVFRPPTLAMTAPSTLYTAHTEPEGIQADAWSHDTLLLSLEMAGSNWPSRCSIT